MVPLISQRSNADLSSGIAALKNVCRLLQCARKLRPRSTEVRGLYRRSTSRTIEHHLYADDIQLSDDPSITSVAASFPNMKHCIDDLHTWCITESTESNEVRDHLVPDPCQSEMLTALRPVYMSAQLRSSLPVSYVTSLCCSTAN